MVTPAVQSRRGYHYEGHGFSCRLSGACYEFVTTLTFRVLHGNRIVPLPIDHREKQNLEYGKALRVTLTLEEHGDRIVSTPFETIVTKKDTETEKTRRPPTP